MVPIVALFVFTLRQTLLSKKIVLTLLILVSPCALLLLIRKFETDMSAMDVWEMYHAPAHFFLMWALTPLVCLVHGTGLIGAEAESRTIIYLITRRMRRATVLLVKFVATALVLALLCDVAMVGLHFCIVGGRDLVSLTANTHLADWNPTSDLASYLLCLPLAVVSFLAVFTFIGMVTARPLGLAVIYFIPVELILSNLPLEARTYSLSHLLRVTTAGKISDLSKLYELTDKMRGELYPAGGSAWLELGAIILGALILSSVLVTRRELVPTKISRE